MIQCFRIEHEDGYGLFFKKIWDKTGNIICDRKYFGERDFPDLWARHCIGFKNPEQEGLEPQKEGKEYFCAFKSIIAIDYWIKPEHMKIIKELGFKVYEIYATDYQLGKYQVLYTKESIIQQIDISNQFYKNGI